MKKAREKLLKITNEIPESELAKVLDFIENVKEKRLFSPITATEKSQSNGAQTWS